MSVESTHASKLPVVTAAVALVVGSVVVVAWTFGVLAIVQPALRYPSMKFNTSLCLVLIGAAQILLARGRSRRIVIALATLAALIAGASLAEWLLGFDFGIDELIVWDPTTPSEAQPGRMAPVVAITVVLICAALVAEALRSSWTSQVLALVAGFTSTGASVGYFYGALELSGLGSTTRIAPLAAGLLVAVSAGTVFLRPERGLLAMLYVDTLASQVARKLLPATILTPLLSGWLFLQGVHLGWYDSSVSLTLAVMTTLSLLSVVIWITSRVIGRLEVQRREAEVKVVQVSELAQRQAEALASSEQLRSSQRMETLGHLAGSIAHDVNNMMTVVGGYSSVLLKELPRGSALHHQVQEIKRASDRCSALTRHLLAFSRRQVLRPAVLDLGERIAELVDMLPMMLGDDIKLVTRRQSGLWHVRADPAQVDQVVINLAINARDAMPDGGELRIETENVEIVRASTSTGDLDPGQYVRLTIKDSGVGMDDATLARAFEPFFTTKPVGTGTGLGLSTVYGIVAQSHGAIQAESRVGEGTTFRVYLPRVEGHIAAVLPEIEAIAGSETILLAEDDEGVRDLLKAVFGRAGYRVLEAPDGTRAHLISRTHDGPIHLLVTDVIMPGMGGVQLATELALTHPLTRVLFISGFARSSADWPAAGFLQKPFTPDSLLVKVRQMLDEPASA